MRQELHVAVSVSDDETQDKLILKRRETTRIDITLASFRGITVIALTTG